MRIQLAYLIDLIFLLLAPAHPSLFVIALLQYVVRRNAFVCRGFASFGVVRALPNALQLILLPGLAEEEDDDSIMPIEVENEAESAAEPRTPRTEDVNARSADQDATFSDVQRSSVQAEPAEIDPPNADELRRLALAIRHNAEGATKQQAIETAFGVKKGGSAAWRRASQLFDAATAPPSDPYPTLRARQRPSWQGAKDPTRNGH